VGITNFDGSPGTNPNGGDNGGGTGGGLPTTQAGIGGGAAGGVDAESVFGGPGLVVVIPIS
jgi:hypothetical protein